MAGTQGYRVVDADGHVIEPPDLWPRYLEKRHHANMPRPTRDDEGRFCYRVGDRLLMRTASALAVAPRDAEGRVREGGLPRGGWDPHARLEDMDHEGIEVAVLFPTLAFFFPELRDPELHAALCRAYNDFFFHYNETPLLVVNTSDIDFVGNADDLESLLTAVRRMKKGTQYYNPMGRRAEMA